MKMKYEKPMAAVERYELSQAIASCITKIGPNGSNSCVRTDADTPPKMREWATHGWFVDDTCLPTAIVPIGTEFDGICYHTQALATFQS